MRRALFALGALIALTTVGCQTRLTEAGSYSELRNHAMKFDSEFEQFHSDIKDVVFGLEPVQKKSVWQIYTR